MFARLYLLFLCCFSYVAISAQTDSLTTQLSPEKVWTVGVKDIPPYCMQDDQGNWTGLAVRLWRQVAEAEQIRYEWKVIGTDRSTIDAVEEGTVDLAVYLPVEGAKEQNIDYLVPYYQTTLGIALPKRNDFIAIAKGFFTIKFLYIVLSLSALLLVVAIVFWFLEREKNDDDFGGDRTWYEGIGASFWWAGVTLTTIGYGDKSPQSFGGRALAMLWMLVSLFVTATLTASLVSVFGSENIVNFPDDLKESKVMVIEDSPVANYLKEQSIDAQEIKEAQKGLEALKKEEIDYFVHNTGSLRYLKKNNEAYAPSIQSTYKVPQAFAFGLAENQQVSEQLIARLHTILLSENWQTILKEYGLDYSVSE